MTGDLKNILTNSNKDIDNQELLNYLSNQLPQHQQHDIEKQMAEDDFMNDAVEGLQQISNKNELPVQLEKLNEKLQHHLSNKKERKKRRWKDNPQIYLIIVIVLLLIMVCFVVLKKHADSRPVPNSIKPPAANSSVVAKNNNQ